MKIAPNVLRLIGETPLVNIPHPEALGELYAKLEFFNPGSSLKDRIALAMIEDAERDGRLTMSSVIIEPTSGNTGIGLAMVAAIKGYRLIIVMPDSMSVERRRLIAAYGAELVLTPAALGMKGAIEKAGELAQHIANVFLPLQFENPSNPRIHRETTAQELWRDTDGTIDVFVAGVGTGGTITGVGEELKKRNPDIRVVAVEPAQSPVLSGGAPGAHRIQGIGAGFVPRILRRDVIDEVRTATTEQSVAAMRLLAHRHGILCGISSGATFSVALELARCREYAGKKIVFMVADNGERYLSESYYQSEE
ncbi:MAG TPA: cysteine synthase A [bacterium]|nr:cysteine synthase A [bacterium]